MTQTKDDEDIDMEIYVLLANLRSSGDGDYHNLTSTYLIANSILVSAVYILLNQSSVFGYYVSIILSILGLILCLQMVIAQGRFRAQNMYWEKILREIENKPNWKKQKIFNNLKDIMDGEEKLGEEVDRSVRFAIKYHKKIWASRMKLMPWLFGIIFILSLIWSTYNIVN
ncbi:MAG TPA: hypothetical protein ENI51_07185 [Candidatus Atribacteria bacterium]|nr:hypothetical protein [Candidatus Atribacteria bacterium]